MSRYRKLSSETRAFLIASATGVALMTPSLGIFAVDTVPKGQSSAVQAALSGARAEVPTASNPSQHPQGTSAVIQQTAGQNPVQQIPVQVNSPRPLNPTNAQPIAQAAGTRETPKKQSFFDRILGRFRGNSSEYNGSSAPPQDPGMRYPTASGGTANTAAAGSVRGLAQPNPLPVANGGPPNIAPLDVDDDLKSPPRAFPTQGLPQVAMKPTEGAIGFVPPLPGEEFIAPDPGQHPVIVPQQNGRQELSLKKFEEVIDQAPRASEFSHPIVRGNSSRPVLDLEDMVTNESRAQETMSVQVQESAPAMTVVTEQAPLIVESEPASSPQLMVDLPEPAAAEDEFFPGDAATANQSESVAAAMPERDLNVPEPEINVTPPAPRDTGFFFEDEVPAPEPATVAETAPQPAMEQAPVTRSEEGFDWAEPEPEVAVTEEAPTEEPYTGLSLEENLFVDLPLPPPNEEQVVTASPEGEQEQAPGFVQLEEQTEADLELTPEPEPQPELPPLFTSGPATAATADESVAPAPTEVPNEIETENRSLVADPDLQPSIRPSMTPQLQPTPSAEQQEDPKQRKMRLIQERAGLSGLKGFCPVALRDTRELLDTDDRFSAVFNNREYSFSSAQALENFLASPAKYAPALRGTDVIHYALTGEEVEGSLDHAVWYKGRLYLFDSVETMETFVAAPSSHATNL